jgi:hypothetical protein
MLNRIHAVVVCTERLEPVPRGAGTVEGQLFVVWNIYPSNITCYYYDIMLVVMMRKHVADVVILNNLHRGNKYCLFTDIHAHIATLH